MPLETIATHTLLPDLIVPGGVVVDCGANMGAFSMAMIERFGCQVVAFEASPEVFQKLPRHDRLRVRNVAVCGRDGPVRLLVDADITRTAIIYPDRVEQEAIELAGRKLSNLLSDAGVSGNIEVLKLDIEGAELDVIESMPDELIMRFGQITVEFHDVLGYHSTEQVEQRIGRIASLGFRELFWSRRRNTGDVLLVNPKRLGPVRHIVEQSIVRPVRAAGRLISRAKPG